MTMNVPDRVQGVRRGRPLSELARTAVRSARNRVGDACWAVRGRRTVTVAGISVTFRLDDRDDARFLRRFLDIEGRMLADLLGELHPEDVFYDVGAAGGFYTCFASAVLDDERVIAFEPNPDVRATLHRRLETLGVEPEVFGYALADSAGEAALDNPARERSDWRGTPSVTTDPGPTAVPIETRAGDDLVAAGEIPRPTVVKIDVEGAEPLAIEGLRGSLAHEDCRLVYCEVHRESDRRRSPADYGSSPAAVEASLADLGFGIERIGDRGGEYLIKATKRPSGDPDLPEEVREYVCVDDDRAEDSEQAADRPEGENEGPADEDVAGEPFELDLHAREHRLLFGERPDRVSNRPREMRPTTRLRPCDDEVIEVDEHAQKQAVAPVSEFHGE